MVRASRLVAVAVAALLAVAGCGDAGPKLYPVTGQVFIDGKPAEHATVVFHPADGGPAAVKPRATVKANGSFALTTHTTGDGAPAGEYRVTVERWLTPAKQPDQPPVNQAAARYASPDTSKLTAKVGEGPTEVPKFELTK